MHLTSFLFLNLISLQITASGFSPRAQGLKRKELLLEDWDSGVFAWLKEQGLGDVHHEACDEVAGAGAAAVVSQQHPPSVPQSLSEQLGLLQQLENSLLNCSHPHWLVWAPELGWLLTLQWTPTCLFSHQMLHHEQRQSVQS